MRTNKEQIEFNELVAALSSIGTSAYIKPLTQGHGTGFGLYASDGTELATFPSREAAYFTARQHDLEPVSVH